MADGGRVINGRSLVTGLALLAAGGAAATFAQVQVTQNDVTTHKELPMHPGATTAVQALRADIARVDKEAAVRAAHQETYLKAIAASVGAKVNPPPAPNPPLWEKP